MSSEQPGESVSADATRARLREMITLFRVSVLVSTAAEYRLADHLAGGPKTSAELCGAHAPTLDSTSSSFAPPLTAARQDVRICAHLASSQSWRMVLPPDSGPLTEAVFSDITMIVHTRGRERTEAE